jgi:hypothetical protein
MIAYTLVQTLIASCALPLTLHPKQLLQVGGPPSGGVSTPWYALLMVSADARDLWLQVSSDVPRYAACLSMQPTGPWQN